MADLTATAQFSRKAFLVVMLISGLALTVFLLITFSAPLRNSLFPPQAVAIAAFGKLPPVNLSEGIAAPGGVNYTIETVSGNLPNLPTIVNVFAIEPPLPSFGDLDRAKKIANVAGFGDVPVSNIGGRAAFTDKTLGTLLTIDTASGNFVVTSDYFNNQKVLSTNPQPENISIETAKRFIYNFNFSESDFPSKNIETINYKVDGYKLSEALSVSSSNLMQVNFSRADLDELPIISASFKNPNLWALVSASGIVAAKNSTQNILKYKFSTYPMMGVSKAFDQLKAGKGVYNKQLKSTNFPIRSIKLGYVETGLPQKYLEPVYIFNSDEGLLAYVEAVDDSWINSGPIINQSTSKF